MDLLTTSALKGTVYLVKNIVDDLYKLSKAELRLSIQSTRADVNDRKVAKLIASVTHVKTLWNIDREVSLYDFYYPSTVEISAGVEKKVSGLKDLGGVQNFVFQGTAGQGKSIFLRYLCGQEIQEQYTTNRLPIFIELRRLQSSGTLKTLLLEALVKFGLDGSSECLDYLCDSKKIVLMLDGFDEIEPSLVTPTVDELENLADRYSDKLQILITSRPGSSIQNSSKFRVCKLTPLKSTDHLPFLKKICDDKAQYTNLNKVIAESKTEVKSLLTTPLMMTLLVMLYKSTQTIPDSVPKFYQELFDVLFYRHDHSKPGFRRKRHTSLDDGVIKKLFSAFCFYVRLKSYVILNMTTFEECLDLALKAIGVSVDARHFKDEIVKTVCLMQEDGFDISFIHKSVLEYYAATFVQKSGEAFALKFYSKLLSNNNNQFSWQIELNFLSQIDEYRYSKYFILPQFERFEKDFSIDFTASFLENKFDSLMEEVELQSDIAFKRSKDNYFTINGWQRGIHTNPNVDLFREVWLNAITKNRVQHDLSALESSNKLTLDSKYRNLDVSKQVFHVKPADYFKIKTEEERNNSVEIGFNYLKEIKLKGLLSWRKTNPY